MPSVHVMPSVLRFIASSVNLILLFRTFVVAQKDFRIAVESLAHMLVIKLPTNATYFIKDKSMGTIMK